MNTTGLRKRGGHERHRRCAGIMGKRPDLKAARQKTAAENKAAYDKLTTEQKIAALNAGGFRAAKQRDRLNAILLAERAEEAQKREKQLQAKAQKKR